MTDRCCEIVDSNDCEAAPGYDAPASKVVTCWSCGRDVCRACSSVVMHRAHKIFGGTRKRRFCADCQTERKSEIAAAAVALIST